MYSSLKKFRSGKKQTKKKTFVMPEMLITPKTAMMMCAIKSNVTSGIPYTCLHRPLGWFTLSSVLAVTVLHISYVASKSLRLVFARKDMQRRTQKSLKR